MLIIVDAPSVHALCTFVGCIPQEAGDMFGNLIEFDHTIVFDSFNVGGAPLDGRAASTFPAWDSA